MFGKRLRELRESKNLSMDTMVEKYNSKYDAKMNKSTLSRYENGLQVPIYTVVVNLADFFGVSIDFLLGRTDDFVIQDIPTNIGNKIRTLRKRQDLTQEELADAAGTKKQTIHKYETGIITNIPASKVKAIADRLSTTPAYLMGWGPEEDSVISDLQAAFKIQELEKIRMQQEANTYTIHGSNGNGAVVITSDIPKDKYLLIGDGEASELTKSQYSALKGVLEAMSSNWEDK